MSSYTFFFDETLHDRKIGLSDDGGFNFLKDTSFDTYVGAFWGIRTKKLSNVSSMIETFESAQKQRFGLGENHELKTTTISKTNFKNGFRSFNYNSYCFYSDLFDLIHLIKPELHITMISKMELYVRHFFQNVDIGLDFVIKNSFYYSITKFIITYGTEELRNELLSIRSKSDIDHFVDSMISELQIIIRKNANISRKCRENEVFKRLILILENADNADGVIEKQYPFEYRCSFDGLCRLLNEKRINISTILLFRCFLFLQYNRVADLKPAPNRL